MQVAASSLIIDRKIRYQLPPKTASAFKVLRDRFASAMSTRMKGKELDETSENWFKLGIECIAMEVDKEPETSIGVA